MPGDEPDGRTRCMTHSRPGRPRGPRAVLALDSRPSTRWRRLWRGSCRGSRPSGSRDLQGHRKRSFARFSRSARRRWTRRPRQRCAWPGPSRRVVPGDERRGWFYVFTGTPYGRMVMSVHKLSANLMWAYLIGHALVALAPSCARRRHLFPHVLGQATPDARNGSGRMKILIVEDDEDSAAFLAQGIAARGHEASVARNGRDGLVMATGDAALRRRHRRPHAAGTGRAQSRQGDARGRRRDAGAVSDQPLRHRRPRRRARSGRRRLSRQTLRLHRVDGAPDRARQASGRSAPSRPFSASSISRWTSFGAPFGEAVSRSICSRANFNCWNS